MAEKVVKTVKVSESTAEEWDTYVEESAHIDSMSHLFRLSVHNEINGPEAPAEDTESAEEQPVNGEVLTQLQQIETDIRDLESKLDGVIRTKDADRTYDLKRAVFTALPMELNAADFGSQHVSKACLRELKFSEPTSEKIGHTTAGDLATRLGADEERVSEVLEELYAQSADVERIVGTGEGTPIYYRTG